MTASCAQPSRPTPSQHTGRFGKVAVRYSPEWLVFEWRGDSPFLSYLYRIERWMMIMMVPVAAVVALLEYSVYRVENPGVLVVIALVAACLICGGAFIIIATVTLPFVLAAGRQRITRVALTWDQWVVEQFVKNRPTGRWSGGLSDLKIGKTQRVYGDTGPRKRWDRRFRLHKAIVQTRTTFSGSDGQVIVAFGSGLTNNERMFVAARCQERRKGEPPQWPATVQWETSDRVEYA